MRIEGSYAMDSGRTLGTQCDRYLFQCSPRKSSGSQVRRWQKLTWRPVSPVVRHEVLIPLRRPSHRLWSTASSPAGASYGLLSVGLSLGFGVMRILNLRMARAATLDVRWRAGDRVRVSTRWPRCR